MVGGHGKVYGVLDITICAPGAMELEPKWKQVIHGLLRYNICTWSNSIFEGLSWNALIVKAKPKWCSQMCRYVVKWYGLN